MSVDLQICAFLQLDAKFIKGLLILIFTPLACRRWLQSYMHLRRYVTSSAPRGSVLQIS